MKHAALLAILFACAPALAQKVRPAAQPLSLAPVFRNYSTDNGLPNNWVYEILQDSRGYIWVSTDRGVCRFDGYRFEQFPDTLLANQTSVLTNCMMEDACGRMWWTDFQHRIFYLENGRIVPWQHNHLRDSLPKGFDFPTHLIVGGCGDTLWFGAHFFGMFFADKAGKWGQLPRPDGALMQVLERHGKVADCRVLFGISYPKRYPFSAHIPPIYFQSPEGKYLSDSIQVVNGRNATPKISRLRNNDWLLSAYGYHYLLRKGKILWTAPHPQKNVERVFENDDGKILVAHITGGGVDIYESREALRACVVSRSLLEGFSVARIFKDREGGWWFSTQEQGVFYCSSLESGVADALPDLKAGPVSSVVFDGTSTLYAALENGQVFELDLAGNTLRDISPPKRYHTRRLHHDRESQTLFSAGNAAQIRREGKWLGNVFTRTNDNTRNALSVVQVVKKESPDRWWGLGLSSLREFDLRAKTCTDFTLSPNAPRLFSFTVDAAGRPWASDRRGLMELRDGRYVRPSDSCPAFQQPCMEMAALPDTSLVICPKGHGAVFWKQGRPPVEVNVHDGLAAATISRLCVESDSVIWACSDRGASRIVRRSECDFRIENFTVREGLPSNTVNDVAVTPGFYWFATAKGLFRMERKLAHSQPPKPVFSGFFVNNSPYNEALSAAHQVSLPYDSANIAVEFVSLHLRSGGEIAYRYRLLTSKKEAPWTLTRDRRLNFSNLASGKYQLEVAAQNTQRQWSETARLSFHIRPPWWLSGWFLLLAWAIGTGSLYALYRYRVRQLMREKRLYHMERKHLQARMHPHFVSNCLNSIQMLISEGKNSRAMKYLARFAKLSRSILDFSEKEVISLEEETESLKRYLSLEALRWDGQMQWDVEMPPEINPRDIHLPPMLVQPLVENAFKHGMAGKENGMVRVRFRTERDYLVVQVEDNGPGFRDKEKGHLSHGFKITRRRLELWNRRRLPVGVTWQNLTEGGQTTGFQVTMRVRMFA
ncbi:MAG: histidine kinase [Saprospiraceae bacterium]